MPPSLRPRRLRVIRLLLPITIHFFTVGTSEPCWFTIRTRLIRSVHCLNRALLLFALSFVDPSLDYLGRRTQFLGDLLRRPFLLAEADSLLFLVSIIAAFAS